MSKRTIRFDEWFRVLTNHTTPHPWQSDLAEERPCRNQLIRVPTGLGKTEGVLAAWAYHRVHLAQESWPRRLAWCLPMRVLVEQTEQVARQLLNKMPEEQKPSLHIAMGGEDSGDWVLYPERPAIIIGTQDMLLSRALNRGYASARARWPMEFGLLNHDTLWVMDEVQLMDVGLATSAQLQAFREEDLTKGFRPCHTWWMSATLQPAWLNTVDTESHHASWIKNPCQIAAAQRRGGLWNIKKTPKTQRIHHDKHSDFAKRIQEEHENLRSTEFGKITLVVCNTVDRACQTFDALSKIAPAQKLELVHSHFRPSEREAWRDRFLSRTACTSNADRIIVATQVVEAGVDISAGCLITELAPWSSLVQRFGRCARYGGSGTVLVVDRGRDEKISAPYEPKELESALRALEGLKDAGISSLEEHEAALDCTERVKLFPYSPDHLLLRREFDELFDTTPDLTGADLDVSRFIRGGDERDLLIFWADLGKDESPSNIRSPHRRELCPAPFLKARDWLCGEETKPNYKPRLRGGMRAWVWDWIDGKWAVATRASLLPGRIVCVAAHCGGYLPTHGFAPNSKVIVTPAPPSPPSSDAQAFEEADNRQDGEQLSFSAWKTIACHSSEVAKEVVDMANQLSLPEEIRSILEHASIWHDWGKAHPAFQGAIRAESRPARNDLAKAPDGVWRRGRDMYSYLDDSETRPAFRHELASALGLFSLLETYESKHPALLGPWSEVHAMLGRSTSSRDAVTEHPLIKRLLDCSAEDFDLLVYLIASHHGKVRVALHAAPKDQEYRDRDGRGLPIRGVRETDRLPSIVLIPGAPALPEVSLTLSPAALGLSPRTGVSWRERNLGVIEKYGPAALAYLEAILRAADVRASRLETNDPTLTDEGTR